MFVFASDNEIDSRRSDPEKTFVTDQLPDCTEAHRLTAETAREPNSNWKRWGPYLAERQWGTVREDYTPDSKSWHAFPHDQARSRAYRWGEDGLLGISDRQGRLCFALAMWNGKDPILKERMYGSSRGRKEITAEDVRKSVTSISTRLPHTPT